jgi:HTH-type transcriptional regulator / antitoxin HigA
MTGTKANVRRVSDKYFELVKSFPLVPIRDDTHLKEAQEVIDRLLRKRLDSGGEAYLEVLTDLVEAYEDEHHEIEDASEASVLRLMMESNDLTQAELARRVGISASTISAVLGGARSLTRQQVVTMAAFFRVSPSVFLPAG